jgi:hypothetical protein
MKIRGERGQVAYVSFNAKDTDIVEYDSASKIWEAFGNLKRQLTDLHDRRTNHRY